MTYDEALKAIRNGAIAGFLSIGITIITVIVVMSGNVNFGKLYFLNNQAILISLIVYLALSIGVWYKSRIASVILLLLFMSDKVVFFLETKKISGLSFFIAILFIYYFAMAVKGTFVYHKHKNKNGKVP